MERRKKGIVLILIAILIFGVFAGVEFFGKKEPAQTSATAAIPSATPIPTSVVTSTLKPPADAETEEDKKSTALVEIRAEVLQQLQVSAAEFEKQIQIFQNAFGYAGAKKVKDMGEITINYTEHTMTIPCYMMANKKVVKFDVIYNMNKKTWRFVPW
jgi:hypothetical protein